MNSIDKFCLLFLVNSKYPYYCSCGFFIRSRGSGYKHRKKCSMFAAVKTKKCITTELVIKMANVRLTVIEDNFRNEWKKRYGSVTSCPIK